METGAYCVICFLEIFHSFNLYCIHQEVMIQCTKDFKILVWGLIILIFSSRRVQWLNYYWPILDWFYVRRMDVLGQIYWFLDLDSWFSFCLLRNSIMKLGTFTFQLCSEKLWGIFIVSYISNNQLCK